MRRYKNVSCESLEVGKKAGKTTRFDSITVAISEDDQDAASGPRNFGREPPRRTAKSDRKGSGPCFRLTLYGDSNTELAEKWTRPRLCRPPGEPRQILVSPRQMVILERNGLLIVGSSAVGGLTRPTLLTICLLIRWRASHCVRPRFAAIPMLIVVPMLYAIMFRVSSQSASQEIGE
jgi:hypothetical protein